LSQKIQSIEQKLSTTLFNRTTNPISLTYAGERYVSAAKEILRIQNRLEQEIDEINSEVRGRIRIGISSNRAMLLLPKILPSFMKKYPLVNLDLIEHEGSNTLIDLVLNNQIDLAFVNSFQNDSRLQYIFLRREKIILFCGGDTQISKRIPSGSTIDITQTKNEAFIALRLGHGLRAGQDRLFTTYRISPRIILETTVWR
jgi:DNA-binding transcriptional LysR family regulator